MINTDITPKERLQLLWQTARSPDCSPGTPCVSLAAIRWDSRITFSIINVPGLPWVPKRSHTHRPVLRSLTKSWLSFSALPGWRLKRPLTNEECTTQECVKVRFVLKPQGTCAALTGLWFLKLTSLCWLQLLKWDRTIFLQLATLFLLLAALWMP